MPTHQSIAGESDQGLLVRMVRTHPDRFDEAFWRFYALCVAAKLPARPVIIDVGCGPGLLLRDLGQRHPGAFLYGYDVTPAMVEHARALDWRGVTATFAELDVTSAPLPHEPRSVHLVCMSSVLHVVDEPLPVLAAIRRVLAPNGYFLLYDWIRQPIPEYFAWRHARLQPGETEEEGRGYRLFPVHNKYTVDDWRWLLGTAGFKVCHETARRPTHHVFAAAPA